MSETAGLIPDPVPDHPLLRGRREIGRGESSIVLEGDTVDGAERVFKLVSSPTDYAFYTAADRPRGVHFPVVYADYGIVGTSSRGFPFHLLEMERLYPLADTAPATLLAKRLCSAYFEGCRLWYHLAQDMGKIALHHLVVTPFGWNEALREALSALEAFVEEYGALPDLIKTDNLMMRRDGTLVFSDPVFMP